ncbi:MAG: SAM-dependent methyltransferase [Planctomyces sp.]|nr:SAM-dependent methyltransferase [Planctomyces sp.]
MERFLEVYGTLPRAGPGSNELTRRAFQSLADLPSSPRILDVGCGPGMQTIELLRLSAGDVVALDLLPEMISRVRDAANSAGVSDRLTTIEMDMQAMNFPPSSFDVIWSEGAIYLIGFEAGLTRFRPLLQPGGYVAVSEVVWLKPDPPAELVSFWNEYPEIDFIEKKLDVIARTGYEWIDHFVFPPSAWTDHYYGPLENRIAEESGEWAGIPDAEAILEAARNEIRMFREHADYYSYAFFVMRKRSDADRSPEQT